MSEHVQRSPRGAAALGVVMLGFAAWLVANSALFAARDIRVLGNDRLTAERVQRIAGLSIGDNLLRLGTGDAAGSLERHPWVARASVERSLPSTIVVRIVERRPVAWMRDPRGRVLLAVDGTVLSRPARTPKGVPFVGRRETAVVPGQRIAVPQVLPVAGTLPPEIAPRIRAVELEAGQVVLSIRGGAWARYGDATAVEAKHRALASVLRWTRDRGIQADTIDLRFPATPVLDPSPHRLDTPPSLV